MEDTSHHQTQHLPKPGQPPEYSFLTFKFPIPALSIHKPVSEHIASNRLVSYNSSTAMPLWPPRGSGVPGQVPLSPTLLGLVSQVSLNRGAVGLQHLDIATWRKCSWQRWLEAWISAETFLLRHTLFATASIKGPSKRRRLGNCT
jgi:hypothetical protein